MLGFAEFLCKRPQADDPKGMYEFSCFPLSLKAVFCFLVRTERSCEFERFIRFLFRPAYVRLFEPAAFLTVAIGIVTQQISKVLCT